MYINFEDLIGTLININLNENIYVFNDLFLILL